MTMILTKAQSVAADLVNFFNRQDEVKSTDHFGNTVDVTFSNGERVLIEVLSITPRGKGFEEKPY